MKASIWVGNFRNFIIITRIITIAIMFLGFVSSSFCRASSTSKNNRFRTMPTAAFHSVTPITHHQHSAASATAAAAAKTNVGMMRQHQHFPLSASLKGRFPRPKAKQILTSPRQSLFQNNGRAFHRGTVSLKESQSKTSEKGATVDLTELKKQLEEALELHAKNIASTTPLHQLQEAVKDLEKEQSDPSFWDEDNSSRASQVNAQFSSYTRLINRMEQWQRWKGDAQAALEMLTAGEGDETGLSDEEEAMLLEECEEASRLLLQDSKRYELDLLLSGPYDQSPAMLIINAGAGGTEANDWVADLKRMYERHCAAMGFTCTVEDTQAGDVVGYKSVDLLISGPNAFGWLQGEKGTHRLVRLSPFNSNNKRQTTFAGVDVAPADVLDDSLLKNFEVPDNELEITAMRSGGKGGQNVNKVNSAIRIKHIPSGIQVKCTQERSQVMNKDLALRRLKAQLLAVAQEQRVQEIQEIRGDMVEASWGTQIRNYVLHPYKMVKDQRTGWETSNAQGFLDGELLDDCIGAYLRYKASKDKEANL